MSDYKESQGVKTQADNQFKQKLVDGQSGATATKVLSVDEDGETVSAGTNDWGLIALGKSSDSKWRALATDASGNLKVVPGTPSGSGIVSDYFQYTNVAAAGSTTHDKVITSGKTVNNLSVDSVASTGLFRWDVGTWDGTTFTAYASFITSPASPTRTTIPLKPMPVGNGTLAIRVIANNLETTADNGYSTVSWIEE